MGVRQWLAKQAVSGAHALVVELPGGWRARVAVEQAVRQRGWRLADAPADADVLVVCGEPDGDLAGPVEAVWDQLPGPRARVTVLHPRQAAGSLDDAAAALLDDAAQVGDAVSRQGWRPDDGPASHGDMDHGDMDHGDMDHGDMDHGDMDMAPSGIALAGGAADRDGLEMDVLQVPLGPVLTHWPAGLVLRSTLHGDVVMAAEVELLGGAPEPGVEDAVTRAARWCDAAHSVLVLAGWGSAARSARQLRDALLEGSDVQTVAVDLAALRSRLEHSRTLRYLLHGLAPVAAPTLPARLRGDVRERLLALLDAAAAELRGDGGAVGDVDPAHVRTLLPELVAGLELSAVRLLVAGLGADLARATTGATRE